MAGKSKTWLVSSVELIEALRKWRREMYQRGREAQRHHWDLHLEQKEIQRYYKFGQYYRWVPVLVNLAVWYMVYRYAGIKVAGIAFGCLISLMLFTSFLYHSRVNDRFFKPLKELKDGVEEIARGNYSVRVENYVANEMGILIDSFNEMAQKLQDGERIKAEYEANRKALIANISHDLKTPITSVQGYIEVIRDQHEIPREMLDRYLQIIYNNTAYLNRLIDDLFLFSKLDMQKLEFQFETVSIRPFVQDIMEEFQLELQERQTGFDYTDSLQGDCLVRLDRKRLHQVLRNIIENAVKYGNETGCLIRASLSRQGDSVSIAVSDNGPGIPPDVASHIFDRFYRIDSERKKDLASTGLGLAIAKELVDAHGGEITVSSEGHRGACFTIRLPVASAGEGGGL